MKCSADPPVQTKKQEDLPAAVSFRHGDAEHKKPITLSTMHYRLCDDGKEGKSALGAVMRKQLTVMRAVIISGKPYDPNYKPCGKVGTRLTQYRRSPGCAGEAAAV